jgi:hypothetical protein
MSLAQYIVGLIAALRQCDPDAYRRMCQVVGERTARIQLDAEYVYIRMRDASLIVDGTAPQASPDGEGETDTPTVCALLSGDLEVSEAILNGSLTVRGNIADVSRMFQAIEILLDASPRCPRLQHLSQQFSTEAPCCDPAVNLPRLTWYPFPVSRAELNILTQYGLLPGASSSSSR